jgi:hypothetical protein
MSDAQILQAFFSTVQGIVLDRGLQPDERREMLAYMLKHLAELMGDRCAAYSLWQNLMAVIERDQMATRH